MEGERGQSEPVTSLGPDSFAFYAFWPLCSHTQDWNTKKYKKKEKMKSQDIGFMVLLQGAQYFHYSQACVFFRFC